MLVKQIQDYVGIGVSSEFNDNTGSFSVGFIPQIGNSVNFLLFMQLRDLFDQTGLVHHVGKLSYDNLALTIGKCLNIGYRAHPDLSPAGTIGFFRSPGSQDNSARRKIGRRYDLQNLFYIRIPVFIYPIVNQPDNRIHYLP